MPVKFSARIDSYKKMEKLQYKDQSPKTTRVRMAEIFSENLESKSVIDTLRK